MKAQTIIDNAIRSAAELRIHGRKPSLIRMHPLDAETIVASRSPADSLKEMTALVGITVVLDKNTRLGHPVAEFDP